MQSSKLDQVENKTPLKITSLLVLSILISACTQEGGLRKEADQITQQALNGDITSEDARKSLTHLFDQECNNQKQDGFSGKNLKYINDKIAVIFEKIDQIPVESKSPLSPRAAEREYLEESWDGEEGQSERYTWKEEKSLPVCTDKEE